MQDFKGAPPPGAGTGGAFPKRFYKAAMVVPDTGGFVLQLDGRPARTPARNPLRLPSAAAAQAVADEWTAVTATIDPRTMPLTRLVNSVIDGVTRTHDAVLAEVIRYAGSDLLIYRAEAPDELVRAQKAAWDPVIHWSHEALDAPLVTTQGIMFLAQPPAALKRLTEVAEHLIGRGPQAPFRLGALHVMTTLTGSALLGLAVLSHRLDPAAAWSAAHVDEDFQISQWGVDAEAAERRGRRWIDMEAAARLDRLTRDGDA